MPTLVLSERALADLDRVSEFLADNKLADAEATIEMIFQAIKILATHPQIGRVADKDHHELVISQGRTGYIALYEYQPGRDRVLIHAIRHQRETGFDE